MFDTIAGLPMHPLLVHAVVVLLPLTALAAVAVAVRPAWRRAAGPVAVLAGIVAAVSFAAKESGESFQRHLTSLAGGGAVVAREHGEQGDLVPLAALALFLAVVLVWVARRRPALALASSVVAVVVAVGAVGLTVVVGDSGARAVWGSVSSAGR